uniref:Uncharacterized protein n=1 Tax=Arundo donax TaxID=35708 RepID=A0A0A8XZ38_ARUDO
MLTEPPHFADPRFDPRRSSSTLFYAYVC